MKKVIRYVDEDTLEIMEKVIDDGVEELPEDEVDNITALFEQALGCEPDEFTKKYDAMKKAEQEFEELITYKGIPITVNPILPFGFFLVK